MIGCDCQVCRSSDPRDNRLRPSIVLEVDDGTTLLVDTTPDFRQQALRHPLRRLDGVLFTHAHADHILGLDDLRRFNFLQRRPMPCWADAATWASIRQTFAYAFDGKARLGGGVPQIETHDVAGAFVAAGVRVIPVPLLHGRMPMLGYRFGSLAYLTDCNALPDEAWPLLTGLDTLVLDALRDTPHSTHFSVGEALEVARRVGARQTVLTHMTHDLGYAETCARLPAGVTLAYDGLVLDAVVERA